MHEADTQAKAEERALTCAEQRLGDRSKIRLTNQPAQGRQRNLGAARLSRDRVKRAADEGTSAAREGKRPHGDGHHRPIDLFALAIEMARIYPRRAGFQT